ncbi:MAG: YHS domain-containing protein [Candidatus Omnitrophota bacterium]
MVKKIGVGLVVAALILGVASFVLAQTEECDTKSEAVKIADVQEAGNKICPVSGEEINEETKATYEYQGKVYNFCCAGCLEEFKKDPEKYIKKVEEELQAKPEEEKQEMGMMQ